MTPPLNPTLLPPVRNITTQEFPTEVLARSRVVPVVVDFWAPWCGPCRTLGPVLEREVAAHNGQIEMVKVNTDENPELATTYQIQSIPAVKAFMNGTLVAEFVGAQGVEAIRAFLHRLVPSKTSNHLALARKAMAEGRNAEAEQLIREAITDHESADEAAWELARLLIAAGRPAEAEPLLVQLEAGPLADKATPLRRMASFAADAAAFGGVEKARAAVAADSKNWEAHYALACALAATGDYTAALEGFLDLVTRQRKFRDDGARQAMLALFSYLGPENELVPRFRRQLQIVT